MSKHFSLAPNKGEVLFVLGDVITLKLTAAETNGAYSLAEIITVPGGGPYFLHTHIPQETFWILEGDYEVYGQDDDGAKYTIAAPAGSVVHAPGNVAHGFKNVGDTMGKILVMYEPAENMFDFFHDIGTPMDSPLDDPPWDQMPSTERIEEVLRRHKMDWLEPLPGT